jgi:hypothetical protein
MPASRTPVGIDGWPKTVVRESKVPPLKRTVIAPGYTGASYLQKLATKWHITIPPKQESPAGPGSIPADWYTEGKAHPTARTTLTLGGVWDLKGQQIMLQCTGSANAPGIAAFLHDCVEADYPGARSEKAVAWFDGMRPQVDKLHHQLKDTVDSPVYRSGPAASYITESSLPEYGGDFYYVATFGIVR